MPRVKPNRFTRWCGRSLLRLCGWRIAGELPDVPKLVMIVAPHSSNWDGLWGMAVKIACGFEVKVLGKAQLFWWPLGPLLRRLGAIPVDRANAGGVVRQAVDAIRAAPRIWFVVTPEGTRKRVEKWKSGFYKIAVSAQVPILLAYFHYPEKIVGLGPLFHPTGDAEADMAAIRAWYAPWMGKHRGST
ncbi:lysophospholipid acyltransferase family protein [Pseudoxanthomonas spadix]|jgi:1-acyl-sn-glycerol-3-phosphate acyltransferase|uniref:lysophospholipid acyltransferase family protein n=1 Tax=Pseudoxanthomonas spadix TaxID=415229 RepID=UPI000EFDFB20|nr:lysophospholipid acyltransferase family protein [Pseudoxanthomonas spadix]RMW97317.1 acyltransferase [Pseudoxanthomonas spadix]